ncbi:sulfotransferase family 2 domain-containing protein [Parvibaculum sp.]|jgi:hypothetical protein|uniref:sulfotransferase family 2 domain-containing protein n=1 Tax=Parvibaculum sp. TaxID=2024848 RepID=UPI001B19F406|nr:sulfotransferase family 2 domain-containing protein [Parvibaculum sp.]MBO6633074.1 sulfotransferase family 2 domain-containing protein [Parvibaculum sp.]MBO6677387.1 sulfotransferase family 2 domain-containing protein [Parvibaculum sp.]MBO6684546.1 sulfotransferase family 2 domain-containing protein [Parvibaculum sp.]MBO6905745.1 sulfotransferase family 2 domain-containing protein [Parvibaculum sp.]
MNGTPQDRIFFLHLPKTAGTSVARSLISGLDLKKRSSKRIGRGGWVLIHDHEHDKRRKLLRKAKRARFVTGHFTARTYRQLADPKRDFVFTFLRDPASRLESLFRFSRAWKGGWEYPIEPASLKFSEFLQYDHPLHRARVDNLMTRMLGGGLDEEPRSEDEWNELVERACRMLDRMSFVGLTETFDRDFATLCETVGVPALETPRQNRTPARHREQAVADDDTRAGGAAREMLLRCTRHDRRVYEHARRIRDGRYRRAQTSSR